VATRAAGTIVNATQRVRIEVSDDRTVTEQSWEAQDRASST
jgi:hypothetical protein